MVKALILMIWILVHVSQCIVKEWKVLQRWKVAQNIDLKLSEFLLQSDDKLFTSPTAAKKAIRRGLILVDGDKVPSTDFILSGNEEVLLRGYSSSIVPSSHSNSLHYNVQVLYEDEYIAVVCKPQGMLVYPVGSSSSSMPALHTVLLPLLQPCQATAAITDPLRRPMPVHRLDQPTGGVVLVAKTFSSLRLLSQLFSEHTEQAVRRGGGGGGGDGGEEDSSSSIDSRIQKSYLAIVHGDWQLSPIEWQRIDRAVEGKVAMSLVRRLVFPYDGYSLLEVQPLTGRHHQIRRHLSDLGHPILGDARYSHQAETAATTSTSASASAPSYDHPPPLLRLWAHRLVFRHPFLPSSSSPSLKQQLDIACPPPAAFYDLAHPLGGGAGGEDDHQEQQG